MRPVFRAAIVFRMFTAESNQRGSTITFEDGLDCATINICNSEVMMNTNQIHAAVAIARDRCAHSHSVAE
jgi:hypothetical protein